MSPEDVLPRTVLRYGCSTNSRWAQCANVAQSAKLRLVALIWSQRFSRGLVPGSCLLVDLRTRCHVVLAPVISVSLGYTLRSFHRLKDILCADSFWFSSAAVTACISCDAFRDPVLFGSALFQA